MAAAVKRLGDEDLAMKISKKIENKVKSGF